MLSDRYPSQPLVIHALSSHYPVIHALLKSDVSQWIAIQVSCYSQQVITQVSCESVGCYPSRLLVGRSLSKSATGQLVAMQVGCESVDHYPDQPLISGYYPSQLYKSVSCHPSR